VRVEPLFIDEGFDRLDADTLRIVMDALDCLQSMGRKVGVISHALEMTERISTRTLVQRTAGAKFGGGWVRLKVGRFSLIGSLITHRSRNLIRQNVSDIECLNLILCDLAYLRIVLMVLLSQRHQRR